MGWVRLSMELDEAAIEPIEETLRSLGAVAVTVTGAAGDPLLEPAPGAVPLWRRCRLTGLFQASVAVPELERTLAEAGVRRVEVDVLEEQDWQNQWRQHATRARFGERLWLVPRDAEPPGEPALRLDPGLAFGSGSHPTTRLCLDWLARHELTGLSVLDYGCGSGVLGLAARKLGCERVLAVDHDPQALLAARDNAAYNALADDRFVVGAPEALGDSVFDLVLANILANPLIELAPRLSGALDREGVLVLSGMLEPQWRDVAAAYPELDFEPPCVEADEEGQRWVRLTGRRGGSYPSRREPRQG